MEGKKSKRGRPKSVGGQPSRKKSRNMDASEQEMREKIEAANVLSSLKFMAPQSQEASTSTSSTQAAENAEINPLTRKTLDKGHGNPARPTEATPVKERPVSESEPHVKQSPLTKQAIKKPITSNRGVVLSEQANKFILTQLYNSLLTRQSKAESQTITTSTSNIPSDSIIPTVEALQKGAAIAVQASTVLPSILQPFNPVNSAVVAALKNAISVGMAKIHNSPKESGSHLDLSARHTASRQQIHERVTYSPDSDKKTESQETNLPLKKRRVLANEENASLAAATSSSPSVSQLTGESDSDVKNLLRLAQSTQMTSMISETPTHKPYSGDGYKPIDPSASLRVLSDVKQALTPDDDGDLPLHIAVVHKNNALVKRFVEIMTMSGKSVDRYNKLMQTPLHLAVLVEEPEIIMTLLASQANPNLVDRNGCTAMHLAVQKGFYECLVTVLEYSKYHCNLNTRNYEGYSPLHTTVENDDIRAMITLLKNGANIDSQDGKAGRSVLYYAVEYRRYDMCSYLHLQEASLDLTNYAGITAAMAAQSTNQDRILDLIGKPLEGSRPLDGSLLTHSSRKLPLPRIPSKASLIGPDEKPFSMSRTNSIEDVKPYPVRRPSFSSPVDLSLKDTVKTEDIKPFMKTENPSLSASNSILKSTLTAGNTNYKPAKLVEKHTVLVEQLQRQNRASADPGPYIYLSKDKYKALLELSMQRHRAAQSIKATAGWTKARTLSVDETHPKDSPLQESTLKSDLTFPSKTSLKGKSDKTLLTERENEILERIKSAKSKEGKEGQALLSLVLDKDLSRNLSKLGEICEPSVSVEKQQVPSMRLRTILSGANNGRDKPAANESILTNAAKQIPGETTNEKQKDPVSLGKGSGVGEHCLEENTNIDVVGYDSDDLKLSQGFDTQNVGEMLNKIDVGETENLVKSCSKHKKEEKNATEKSSFDEYDDIAEDKPGTLADNKKVNIAETTALQVEDSSSVEVQGNLSMDEDDTEDGALVIDEKAEESKSLKSSIEHLDESKSDTSKTNDEMKKSGKKAAASPNGTIATVQISLSNDPAEGLSCVAKDKHVDSESKTGKIVSSSEDETCTGSNEDESNISGKPKPSEASVDCGTSVDKSKGLLTERTCKEKDKQTDQCSQNKERMNSDLSINEESMCKVHERTEWETESIATCQPPPLTKFEQPSQAKNIDSLEEMSKTSDSSPPVLSRFGFSSAQLGSCGDKEALNQESLVSDVNDSISNDSVERGEGEFEDAATLDKSTTENSSSKNKDSKTLNTDFKSDVGKTEESEEAGRTRPSVARWEPHEYINDSGFQFYLKERGVKTGEGVDLEQHYLAYKNVEDRILRDVGIIPLVKKANDKKSILCDGLEEGVNDKEFTNIDRSSRDLNNENNKNILLNSANTMSVPSTSKENTSVQEGDQSDDETLTLHTDFKTINVSKAHTLYFFDGQNYRAVKVYVDDTEASSEQFKKMFSESLNKGLGSASVVLSSHNGPTQVSSATVHSVPERICETLPVKEDDKMYLERAKDDNLVSYGPSRDKNNVSLTKTSKSASFDSGRVQQSLRNKLYRQGTQSDQSAAVSKVTDNRSLADYFKTLKRGNVLHKTVHPNTSDMNLASIVDNVAPQKTILEKPNEVQDLSKRSAKVISNPVMSQILSLQQSASKPVMVPRTLGTTPTITSEGTITRVNPDIKNRLSKALQSPGRKLNITKSDSSDRLLIPIARTDSSERLAPVTYSTVTEVPVTREGNLRLQM